MPRRELRGYVDDLLAGRRAKPFTPDEFEAAQMRTAIALRAAVPGADEPRPEFLDALKARLGADLSPDSAPAVDSAQRPSAPSATRRLVIVGTTAAATAAVAAVSAVRLLTGSKVPDQPGQAAGDELRPTDGSWQAVATSQQLPEGAVHSFDLRTVNGFVRRVNGRVEAVSGVCTHQGCKLWFDQPADRLRCPCHSTSFSPAGEVLTHALPIAPKPLPRLEVREQDGVIEVLAPPKQPT